MHVASRYLSDQGLSTPQTSAYTQRVQYPGLGQPADEHVPLMQADHLFVKVGCRRRSLLVHSPSQRSGLVSAGAGTARPATAGSAGWHR